MSPETPKSPEAELSLRTITAIADIDTVQDALIRKVLGDDVTDFAEASLDAVLSAVKNLSEAEFELYIEHLALSEFNELTDGIALFQSREFSSIQGYRLNSIDTTHNSFAVTKDFKITSKYPDASSMMLSKTTLYAQAPPDGLIIEKYEELTSVASRTVTRLGHDVLDEDKVIIESCVEGLETLAHRLNTILELQPEEIGDFFVSYIEQ